MNANNFSDAGILIVDDQVANIEVLADFLDMQGYTRIRTTTDPREVILLIGEFAPDLILLDLNMPYLSGYDVLEQIRKMLPETAYLPVLVLTADINPEAKKRALANGATDFLSKPFDLIEVGLRIKNLLYTRHVVLLLQSQNEQLEELVRERTRDLEETNAGLREAKRGLEQSQKQLQLINLELEDRVRDRTQQIEETNKQLEAFSYSVSHDLKAPLRHMQLYAEILKSIPVERSEEEQQCIEVIMDSAIGMAKLIDALLSFSRINRAELNKAPIGTRELVDRAVSFLETETKQRKITFRIGDLPDCTGDEQLIRQVWINLISNAVKYTVKKEEALIDIGGMENENEIEFFVKDNGAGFDMKYAGKLFGVFQRLHKQSEYEGVGIGLANVRSIVTRHGGNCSAEGEPGVGATFRFTLPK